MDYSKLNIVFFDGVCNFCNASVNRIIRFDKKNIFHFSALQSQFTSNFLEGKFENFTKVDSILLYTQGKVLCRTEAIIEIAKLLGFPYNLAIIFSLIPSNLRDFCYDKFAENRYKFLVEKESCLIPSSRIKAKFIDTYQ